MDVTSFAGPKGVYAIERQNDDRWSVELIFTFDNEPGLKGSKFVRDSAGRMGWQTREEALKVARGHAGIFLPPDRRGLVAHTKAQA